MSHLPTFNYIDALYTFALLGQVSGTDLKGLRPITIEHFHYSSDISRTVIIKRIGEFKTDTSRAAMDNTIEFLARASSNFSTSLPNGTISALIGTPPATERDYYIAQYFLYSYGLKTDPILGSPVSPKRPDGYVFETHGPGIIASMSVAIVVMTLITGLRLGIRIFRRGLRVGMDDVFIVPGYVSGRSVDDFYTSSSRFGRGPERYL